MKVSPKLTQSVHTEFEDVFRGIFIVGQGRGQVLLGISKTCSICIAKPFMDDKDQASEWYNSFVLVPNPNGKVRLCLDPARINQVLIGSLHQDLASKDIHLQLAHAH